MSWFEIKEIVLDENNEPWRMADGKILCQVINNEGM